ncbi:MAG: hypothetical protein ISN26_07640 [Betaproteobacteria bacterium AqS2]|uniref:Uncharacterized protein n=1 Tax=Candidatus Amphirhobacter heronislandensis TaxID=1732024 RepID=A0A930UDJ6_9GAMM|nr:hypothetical protein [Betaproteobacteria bacterium AqS2]
MLGNLLLVLVALTLAAPLLLEMVGLLVAAPGEPAEAKPEAKNGFDGVLSRALQVAAAAYVAFWLGSSINLLDGLLEDPDLPVEQIIQIQEQQASLMGSGICFLLAIVMVLGIVRALERHLISQR